MTRSQAITILAAVVASSMSACSESAMTEDPIVADCEFNSTYEAIQATIFEAHGCTASACHGQPKQSAQGQLDLREGFSHAALVRVASDIDLNVERVFPGDQDRSLLYRKLQETTEVLESTGLGQAMPLQAEPLSDDQLEAVRLWIRGGASQDAIVEGTMELLGCAGTFEADPNKIEPLPPPVEGAGVQLYAGGWDLDAEAEDEVCFATYYDFRDQVPAEFQIDCEEFGPGRKCFAYRRNELAQDGQSHHSIVGVYTPESDPTNSAWGPWTCLGGTRHSQVCDPTVSGVCGDRAQCTTPVVTGAGCTGYPHAPADFRQQRFQLTGAQESTFVEEPQVGVYSVLPLDGFIAWNSHAFNLTTKDTTVEQWVNLIFAPVEEQLWLQRQIFNTSQIYSMTPVGPFATKEICMTFSVPRYARLMTLSSHMHKRGKLFRIWLPPNDPCQSGVAGCSPATRDADYQSRIYNDPVYTSYDPPLAYEDASEEARTFKACALYDNGATDPIEVKRESTKPNTPTCALVGASCGCAPSARVCLFGDNQGASCAGDDAVCGPDGLCDACPLRGGITTDDEMFIPLGSFFVQSP